MSRTFLKIVIFRRVGGQSRWRCRRPTNADTADAARTTAPQTGSGGHRRGASPTKPLDATDQGASLCPHCDRSTVKYSAAAINSPAWSLPRPSILLQVWHRSPLRHFWHDFPAGQHLWSWSTTSSSTAPQMAQPPCCWSTMRWKSSQLMPCDADRPRQRPQRHR